MATADTARTEKPSKRKYASFDEYVDYQISKTRATIKSTDILTTVTGVFCVVFGYLLTFVVFEHWVISSGFSAMFRAIMLSIISLGCLSCIAWRVIIPSIRKVNSLFAAKVLEESSPELDSNLINLVDLRNSGREIPPAILNSVEKHAAQTLTNVDIDSAVDRRPLMRMAYILLAIVVISCLYTVLSPKKISASVMRAIFPTSEASVSTSTTIIEVKPGSTEVLARTHVKVSVILQDVIPESVALVYTTADRGYVDERVEMRELESSGLHEFQCILSGENGVGVLQDFTYHIEAGDAVSEEYNVAVIQPPSVEVDEVYYEFPAYTKIENTIVKGGNIDVLEGTAVTIRATANMPLANVKMMTFESDDRARMISERTIPSDQINGTEITIKWRPEILEDGTYPHFYHLQCKSERGHTNPDPGLYKIAIRPDLPPEISMIDPRGDITRPANATVPMMFQARDPDFMLDRVDLVIEKDGEKLDTRDVFRGEQSSIIGRVELELRPFNLQKDDVLTYWFEARDNREPQSNRRPTPRLNIKIGDPVSNEEAEKQLEEEKQRQDEELEKALEEQQKDEESEPQETTDETPESQKGNSEENPQQPQDTENSEEKPQEGDPSDEPGNSGQPDQSGDPDGSNNQDGKQESGDQPNSKTGEGEANDEPLSPDGEDDAEVLQKLLDRERKRQEEENKQQDSNQNKSNPDNNNTEQSDKNKQPGEPGDNKPNDPQDNDSNSNNSQPGEKPGEKPADSTDPANKPNTPSEQNPNGSEPDPSKPNEGDPMNEKGDPMNNSNEKSESKGSPSTNQDSKKPDSQKPDSKDPKGSDDANPQENPGTDPNKSNQEEKPQEDGNPKDNEKPGKTGGQQGDSTEGGKEEAEETQEGKGESGEQSKPKAKDGDQTNKPLDGEKKQTEDDPNAKKGTADGTEKGEATPEDDPDAKAKANEDVKRKDGADPKTKPSNEPPEKNPNPDKADGNSSQNPDKADPKKENKVANQDENPDQKTNEPGKKDSQKSSSKQDQQDAGNDPLKGEPKKQKAKQSEGGDGGQSKASDQGNKGSQKEGAGDKTDKPGDAQQSSKPSENKGKGEGSPSNEESNGEGKKGSDGNSKDSSGGSPSESSPSGNEGAGASGGKEEQKDGDLPSLPDGDGKTEGKGKETRGGGSDQGNKADGEPGEGESGSPSGEGEAPNLQNKKKATDLMLKNLQDQLKRGDVDPELLKELGWTEDQMKRFTKRMQRQLQKPDTNNEASKIQQRQFEETLKSLKLDSPSARRNDSVTNKREINGVGPRRLPVANEYRDAYKTFTKSLSKRKKAGK